MGALSIYLLPHEEIEPEQYAATVHRVLLAMDVISNKNYAHDDWWVSSETSSRIFEDSPADDIGFEYCIIYGSKNVTVVPQDPAVSPSCPSCGTDVSDEYYEVVNAIEEAYEEDPAAKSRAYIAAKVSCSCGTETALANLDDDIGIFLSGTWINFEDPPGTLRADWLRELEAATGWQHRYLEYWYT